MNVTDALVLSNTPKFGNRFPEPMQFLFCHQTGRVTIDEKSTNL
jgi:hypothetical protein